MYNGIIIVNKPGGFTSFDVVAKLRGILGQKKIGHTGTLDPDAQGVLPVCLGNATKVCDMLTDSEKEYEAVLLLGVDTDTQDMTGTILEQKEVNVSEEQVETVIRSFVGEQMQIPPMYSALKVNGQKLCDLARAGKVVERAARPVSIYEIEILKMDLPRVSLRIRSALKVNGQKLCDLARAGKVVERAARPVSIYEIEILKMDLPRVSLRIRCSKGTYIRTLCHDIGSVLGCGGCMERLLRTRAAGFSLKEAVSLDVLQRAKETGTLQEWIRSTDSVFLDLPGAAVRPEFDVVLKNGNPLERTQFQEPEKLPDYGKLRVYDSAQHFQAVYGYEEKRRQFRPVKMFLE